MRYAEIEIDWQRELLHSVWFNGIIINGYWICCEELYLYCTMLYSVMCNMTNLQI